MKPLFAKLIYHILDKSKYSEKDNFFEEFMENINFDLENFSVPFRYQQCIKLFNSLSSDDQYLIRYLATLDQNIVSDVIYDDFKHLNDVLAETDFNIREKFNIIIEIARNNIKRRLLFYESRTAKISSIINHDFKYSTREEVLLEITAHPEYIFEGFVKDDYDEETKLKYEEIQDFTRNTYTKDEQRQLIFVENMKMIKANYFNLIGYLTDESKSELVNNLISLGIDPSLASQFPKVMKNNLKNINQSIASAIEYYEDDIKIIDYKYNKEKAKGNDINEDAYNLITNRDNLIIIFLKDFSKNKESDMYLPLDILSDTLIDSDLSVIDLVNIFKLVLESNVNLYLNNENLPITDKESEAYDILANNLNDKESLNDDELNLLLTSLDKLNVGEGFLQLIRICTTLEQLDEKKVEVKPKNIKRDYLTVEEYKNIKKRLKELFDINGMKLVKTLTDEEIDETFEILKIMDYSFGEIKRFLSIVIADRVSQDEKYLQQKYDDSNPVKLYLEYRDLYLKHNNRFEVIELVNQMDYLVKELENPESEEMADYFKEELKSILKRSHRFMTYGEDIRGLKLELSMGLTDIKY